ncbi:unnamed protein product [Rotaria sp. Silwood2]|nr:unnamed protein product [Rotaria sp. Silwood2]CAF2718762.1 unnamed protein product [Rotaria sp. Silwood2]CAF3121379.1 unnamed protein product [Rotaria sp. Silwood2]
MALCLANSLIDCGDFVPYDQLVRYKWWYRHGYMSSTGHCFDIGAATKNSIQEFEKRQKKFANDWNISYEEIDYISSPDLLRKFDVNCSKDGVAGNGALMRLAPVPLFFYRNPEKAVKYSGDSGRITHGDDKAYDACRYYGALIVAALHGIPKDKLISDRFYDDNKQWFENQPLHVDILRIAKGSYKKPGGYDDGIRGKGYVASALEAALWAFWSDNNSFEEGALKAVNLGDDTDTTAAIYGQLAGACYGYQNLPKKWLKHVYAKNFIYHVSNWIFYEGNSWSLNQKTPKNGALMNSYNLAHNHSSISRPEGDISNDYGSMINLSFLTIARKAIDPSGYIGCLYNGRQDCIIPSSNISIKMKENPTYPPIQCHVKSSSNCDLRNLLRVAGFGSELRLSVASGIVKPMGIASVVHYPFVIDENTRVFYYSYSVRKEGLLDEQSFQRSKHMPEATHVIVGIDWGIEVIAVLQLPPTDSKSIDKLLNEICALLNDDMELPDNMVSLNCILSMHIYSNIPSLTKLKSMINLYEAIRNCKKNIANHQPCNYILHPVMTLYSDNNQNDCRLISLGTKLTGRIEDSLLLLSDVEKMWTTFCEDETYTLLEKKENDFKI